MTEDFTNPWTRKTLKTMLGFMYPSEMAELTEDRQVRQTDIPEWVERTLRRECTYVVRRLPRYERQIQARYGDLDSLVKKLAVYHTVRDDWDSLEPCNFEFMQPLYRYYDCKLDPVVKARIDRANR